MKSLTDQIGLNTNMRDENFTNERTSDLNNLLASHTMYRQEENAKMMKDLRDKQENKLNWEAQMQDRQYNQACDNIFR